MDGTANVVGWWVLQTIRKNDGEAEIITDQILYRITGVLSARGSFTLCAGQAFCRNKDRKWEELKTVASLKFDRSRFPMEGRYGKAITYTLPESADGSLILLQVPERGLTITLLPEEANDAPIDKIFAFINGKPFEPVRHTNSTKKNGDSSGNKGRPPSGAAHRARSARLTRA